MDKSILMEKIKSKPWILLAGIFVIGLAGLAVFFIFGLKGKQAFEDISEQTFERYSQSSVLPAVLPSFLYTDSQEPGREVVSGPKQGAESLIDTKEKEPGHQEKVSEPDSEASLAGGSAGAELFSAHEEYRKFLLGRLSEKETKPSGEPFSEREIFEKIFPAAYRNFMASLQDKLILSEYIKEQDRQGFESVESIVFFWGKVLDYLLETNSMSKNDYDRLKKGLHGEFLELIELDWSQYKQSAFLFDFKKTIACRGQDFFEDLWQRTKSFFAKAVLAQIEEILSKKDCYREGPVRQGGVNLWAPCCDCVDPVTGTPLGCLNAVCADGSRPAIWDSVSGICGCG